jgi:hypothetical protein
MTVEQDCWSCKIEVSGLESPFEQTIMGGDSFQALYLGLMVLCRHLEKYESSLRLTNEGEADAGLPLISICPAAAKSDVHHFILEKIRKSGL